MAPVPCCLEPVRPGRRRVRLTVEYRRRSFTAARICRESSLKGVHQRKARPGAHWHWHRHRAGAVNAPVPLTTAGAHWLQAVDIPERSGVDAERSDILC